MNLVAGIRGYFSKDLWRIRTQDLPVYKRAPLKFLKLAILAVRGFQADKADLRASALTLNTLFSIVPVLALLFGISKGFGLETRLEDWLYTHFPEQRDVLRQTVVFARRALNNTQGGLVAGAGVIFLLYSVVRVIGQIEASMNQIWSAPAGRSWGRKFSDYLSLILVGPFLVLGASSLNVFISTWVNRAAEAGPFTEILGPMARMGIRMLPLLLLWLLFTFTYVFTPNTKVKIRSGVIGGIVAAVLYQLVQSFYIKVQMGMSRNNAIYGSFAALPLFIIWLQTSWNIVLLGAEMTQQHQNFASNELDERAPSLSIRAEKRIAAAIGALVIGRFSRGEAPAVADQIGAQLGIPSRILNDLLRKLVAARILSEVAAPGNGTAYQPARAPALLTQAAIMEELEKLGEDPPEVGRERIRERKEAKLEHVES